jgi:hypothetical protein
MEQDSKRCFKCGQVKPLDDFYRHSQMADGYFGKCRECCKAAERANYVLNKDAHKKYEREREARPERRAAKARYQATRRETHPDRYKANTAVGNALRDGKLVKGPCGVCGTTDKVQAHHADYSRPLEVTWLCFRCHRAQHGQQVE